MSPRRKRDDDPTARDLLHAFMEHEEIDAAWVQDLIDCNMPEGQHIEFKAGSKLRDLEVEGRRATGEFFRRYVFGFANADGGLLVIGIGELNRDKPSRKLVIEPIQSASPDARQIGQYLDSAAGLLHPPVLVEHIEVDGGTVLVVGCLRAARLIRTTEKGSIIHWMRIQDQTMKVPPSLLMDLSLGRRNLPEVELAIERTQHSSGTIQITLRVENRSVLPVHDQQVLAFVPKQRTRQRKRPLAIETHIEMGPGTDFNREVLTYAPTAPPLQPLDHRIESHAISLPESTNEMTHWCVPVLVTGSNLSPSWFEVHVWLDDLKQQSHMATLVLTAQGHRARCWSTAWRDRLEANWPEPPPTLNHG